MKKYILYIICFVLLVNKVNAQDEEYVQEKVVCTDKNLQPEFSNNKRAILEKDKHDAFYHYAQNKSNPDALIWLGRRMGYLGEYEQAIDLFTTGIKTIGEDPRFYRHRGHRYISIRCFDKAIQDLKRATVLFKGMPDEVEPDGMPNELNIPTSTLQTNTWYHLGLAYYLTENWKEAVAAFKECLNISKNNDMYIASAYWLNNAYRRNNQKAAADILVQSIDSKLELIENHDYYHILLVYKGVNKPEVLFQKLISQEESTISSASAGYGLAMYYYFNKEKQKSKELLDRVLMSSQVSSFGYIAAEKEHF